MRVEHADHQQDGGGGRWAAFLEPEQKTEQAYKRQEKDRTLV